MQFLMFKVSKAEKTENVPFDIRVLLSLNRPVPYTMNCMVSWSMIIIYDCVYDYKKLGSIIYSQFLQH